MVATPHGTPDWLRLQAFELAMAAAGCAKPECTLYFDDSTRNIAAGAELGLFAVLVGRKNADVGADLEVRHVVLRPCSLGIPRPLMP